MLMRVGLRYLMRSLDTAQSALIGINVAGLYDIAKHTRAGIKLDNVLAFSQGDTADTLPMAIKMGIAQRFFDDRLMLDLDLDPMTSAIFMGGRCVSTR